MFEEKIEALRKWKDEQKQEKDEAARRFWAFGPAIVAAIISAITAFLIARFMKP